jgi:hypothetical protein
MIGFKKIIGSKTEKKKKLKYLLIWWKNYKKSESTWEPYETIKNDVPELVEEYESGLRKLPNNSTSLFCLAFIA